MPSLSPTDAARNLHAIVLRALSGAALEDYGLSASREQGDRLLRELVSLCLFWAWAALDANLSDKARDRVWEALVQHVQETWTSELGLPADDLADYPSELAQRRRLYESLAREGADPATVASEAAGLIETESVIEPEDRMKLLALLIDLIPADELGEAVEGLEILD